MFKLLQKNLLYYIVKLTLKTQRDFNSCRYDQLHSHLVRVLLLSASNST